jgi:hypothetical protein
MGEQADRYLVENALRIALPICQALCRDDIDGDIRRAIIEAGWRAISIIFHAAQLGFEHETCRVLELALILGRDDQNMRDCLVEMGIFKMILEAYPLTVVSVGLLLSWRADREGYRQIQEASGSRGRPRRAIMENSSAVGNAACTLLENVGEDAYELGIGCSAEMVLMYDDNED